LPTTSGLVQSRRTACSLLSLGSARGNSTGIPVSPSARHRGCWEITRFMSYSYGPHSQNQEMYQLTIKIGQQNRHLCKKGTFFAFRAPQAVEFLFAAFSAHLCRFWIWGQHNPRAPGVVTLQLVETTMVNHRIQLVQSFFHSEYLAISFIWCCFKMF
jgi:hypothetical protein